MTKLAPIVALITPRVIEVCARHNPDSFLLENLRSCAFLELRLDLFPDSCAWPELCELVKNLHPRATILATCRLQGDGGKWPNEKRRERLEFLRPVFQGKVVPNWLDVEGDYIGKDGEKALADMQLIEMTKQSQSSVLLSLHDFHGIPPLMQLKELACKAKALGCAGCKAAVMAHDHFDLQNLWNWSVSVANDFDFFSAFAMGEVGRASRLDCLQHGSTATYATLEQPQAPGQWTVLEMRKAWQVRQGSNK